MNHRWLFYLSGVGILAALLGAFVFGLERQPEPPAFDPVASPYPSAIYATGIVESEQGGGANINVYPEVSGVVSQVLVHEGQTVHAGDVLLRIDDSVQRATAGQLHAQMLAAGVVLEELKAQPRLETLAVAKAQVDQAQANLKAAQDQYDKRRAAYEMDSRSISKDVLDTAHDALGQAATALEVAQRQYALTHAGAWRYDIDNQARQLDALSQSYVAANALLQKYAIAANANGVVLAVNVAPGSYVSSQGVFDSYTNGADPLIVMGAPQEYLAVRCFIDEILVSRLPAAGHIRAQLSVRGSNVKVPLEFVRVQPYVSPKIELSNQRQEKVDLRVLPVIFRFRKVGLPMIYPGLLVDVFIGEQ
ncbi:secretion protein HlyD family protein [Pandoraea anapnoica]|uniref:Secretion protein HlyD family protein n=1 Tax=Pandoraea anapnoica TaxID=2508301 RepID=A0A5E4ZX93_9BURK|nr:biotin/lipoyl-binding protein [Pandoraea anapnoica]VVE65152.1 secretion protein HlyD family protein [Pandoraea anapnoica]